MSIVRSDHKVHNAAGISISGRRIGSRDGKGGGDYPALLLRVITWVHFRRTFGSDILSYMQSRTACRANVLNGRASLQN